MMTTRDTRMPGRRTTWMRRAFVTVTTVWLLALVAVPTLIGHGIGGHPVAVVSAGVYYIGGLVCHQQASRSFHIGGVQMPVCARCAGLYFGGALGVLVPLLAGRSRWSKQQQTVAWWRGVMLAAAIPTGLTLLGELGGIVPSSSELRAVAAVPLGVAVTWVASLVIRGELA